MDDKKKGNNEAGSNAEAGSGVWASRALAAMIGVKDSPVETLMDSVGKTKGKIEQQVKSSKAVRASLGDAYGNSMASIGTDDKVKSFTTYGFSNDSMNWPLWLALYNDSWVFRRAIDKPAQDMVNAGIELSLDDSKKMTEVLDEVEKHKKELIELIQWGRLFGGSVAVMMFDTMDDKDYSKPMSVEKLKKAKRMSLYVTDRWYGCAPSDKTVTDMSSLDYGKPYSYRITFADGHDFTVHHDFIIRFEGRTAPRLVKNGLLQGWGYAEGCHILSELARDDQLKASITSLVNKSLIEVIKMPGMRGLMQGTDAKSAAQVTRRLESINQVRTYNSLTFLDKDDEYQEHGFGGLGGLSDLLKQNMKLISAALDMQGILYGDLDEGFSHDTEAMKRYDKTISNLNESYFRSCMQKLLQATYVWKGVGGIPEFSFGSLVKDEHDKDRVESIAHFQDLLSKMLQDGVISLKQYGMAIKNYAEKGVVDLCMSDEDISKLDDKMEEEMESIKLEPESFTGVKTK